MEGRGRVLPETPEDRPAFTDMRVEPAAEAGSAAPGRPSLPQAPMPP